MLLGAVACLLFLGGTWRSSRHLWGGVALAALLAAGWALMRNPLPHYATAGVADASRYASPVMLDRLALLLRAVASPGQISTAVIAGQIAQQIYLGCDRTSCRLRQVPGERGKALLQRPWFVISLCWSLFADTNNRFR